MTHIVFYEKPGCGGNARQKHWLQGAGHTLEVRNLLAWPWTAASLAAFLDPLPVAEWFNRAAPRVKSGEIQPEALDRHAALALLLAEPLLIRRPLLEAGGQRRVGFEPAAIATWLGSPGLAALDARRAEGCAAGLKRGKASPDCGQSRSAQCAMTQRKESHRRETGTAAGKMTKTSKHKN